MMSSQLTLKIKYFILGSIQQKSLKTCIESTHGGTFYCYPNVPIGVSVPSGTDCIFQCGSDTQETHCHAGRWSQQPSQFSCPCPARPHISEGAYVCYPSVETENEEVDGK